MFNRHVSAMQAAGELETVLQEISGLEKRLEQVPLWRPAAGLAKQCVEGKTIIGGMRKRLERRLVVTLVGPSGAGKSTLLNALAGVDDLSPVGTRRPTTRGLVALSNDTDAVARLFGNAGEDSHEPPIEIKSSRAAGTLEHVILIDTPDTDSTLAGEHMAAILRTVSLSDVLICVFDAENPKRRDHVDLMAPLVRRFHGSSLVAVANKCDRLAEDEIADSVGPDFLAFLEKAWDTKPKAVLFTSARSHLVRPDWDPGARPRHGRDQFAQLRKLVFDTFNQAGFGEDRRVANARQIRDYLFAQTEEAVNRHKNALADAARLLDQADTQALLEALATLRADERRQLLGVQVRLYQAMAQLWMGPVGWMVAIWSRLIVFGSGITALIRFGNPLSRIWGLLRSWRRWKESRSALEALNDQSRVDAALQSYHKALLTRWPDVAGRLIQGGFDPSVRTEAERQNPSTAQNLEQMWSEGLEYEIERSAKQMSGSMLQLLFNLPTLALLGYVGWLTADRFFRASYLTSDFFMHALLTTAIVLLLSFFLLQAIVRLAAGRDRIQRRAFSRVEKTATDHAHNHDQDIVRQVRDVLELAWSQNDNDASDIR